MEKAGPLCAATTTTKIMEMFSNHTTRIHKQEVHDLAHIDLLKLRGEATLKSGKCTKNCSDYPQSHTIFISHGMQQPGSTSFIQKKKKKQCGSTSSAT